MRNPYHFVRVMPGDSTSDLTREAFLTGDPGHVTHDRYVDHTFSGRIVCSLTTETPTVVGAEQKENQGNPTKVSPYEYNKRLAIPATTLKGMFSSLAEAASNSALRCLDDCHYSMRERIRQGTRVSFPRRDLPSTYELFKRAGLTEKLPMNPERTTISIAERMFGFVDQEKGDDATQGAALAGRIHFSMAFLNSREEDALDNLITLKILASPKPPCPPMYFSRNGYRTKAYLRTQSLSPNGRKMYLNQPDNSRWAVPRNANRLALRVEVEPIKQRKTFLFHVDFDNLSSVELGLLCYAIKPKEGYFHRLGLGKPLGLGRVSVTPLGVFLVDRKTRYAEDDLFDAPRYHSIWKNDVAKMPKEGLGNYTMALDLKDKNPYNACFNTLRDTFANKMSTEIKIALESIGSRIYEDVCYPQIGGLRGGDTEHFRWFVRNDNHKYINHGEHLQSITQDKPEVNTLSE